MSQIFKLKPDKHILEKILLCFGCDEYNSDFSFRKKDLEHIDTVNKLKELVPELTEYYFPYKVDAYLTNLTINKSITILRHFLRQLGYNLYSREKYCNGEKFIQYSLNNGENCMSIRNNVTLKI